MKENIGIAAARRQRRRARERNRRIAALFVRRIVERNPDVAHDEHWLNFARILNQYRGAWRSCPALVCRRKQACADPTLACARTVKPPRDPREEAFAVATVYKTLEGLPVYGGDDDAEAAGGLPLGAAGKTRGANSKQPSLLVGVGGEDGAKRRPGG